MAYDRSISAAALLLALSSPAAAQSPAITAVPRLLPHAEAPALHATRSADDVTVDGRLDEPAWADARPAELRVQTDPAEGQPPSERTSVKLIVSGGELYIGARMYDGDPSAIVRRLGRRDDPAPADRLSIWIDGRHDHLTAFRFDVYPAGNRGDAAVGADGAEAGSWDPVWELVTTIDSLGWSAEIRIPLNQLRYDPGSDSWGIQVERFIARKQERSVLAYTPSTERGGVARFGHLEGMADLPRPRRIELLPYSAARAAYRPPSTGSVAATDSYSGSAGADLRLGLTGDLTLDVTVNPDFGQVELDPAVVNLGAFETILEEKRPFFVEGADLFRFGQLRAFTAYPTPLTFFSRRIGRAPQVPVPEADGIPSSMPEQATILAAAKLTGKAANGWSVAILEAVTQREEARYVTATAPAEERRSAVEPLTNYFVGRVQRESRAGRTAIGGIATAVNRRLDVPELVDGLRSEAYLVGVDLNHAWADRAWALDASVARSHIAGSATSILAAQRSSARYYHRPDAQSFELDPTRTSLVGHAARIALTKVAGGLWAGSVALGDKSPGYETNDLGLTGVVGRRSIATDVRLVQTRPGSLFRNYTVALRTGSEWNYDGDRTTVVVDGFARTRFRNFWNLAVSARHNFPSFDDALTRGGPLARLPTRSSMGLDIESDERGPVVANASIEVYGNGGGGWLRGYELGLTVRPTPGLRVGVEPQYQEFVNVSQFVAGVADPLATETFGQRVVFARAHRHELALETRVDWTLRPGLSLQAYVQPLLSSANYRELKEFVRPGSFDFAVYGRDRGTITPDDAGGYIVDPDGDAPAPPFAVPDRSFNLRSLRASVVLRWEYRPGSALTLVWQQRRSEEAADGRFRPGHDFGELWGAPAENVLAVKATYWMGL